MNACCCSLAGTQACLYCRNRGFYPYQPPGLYPYQPPPQFPYYPYGGPIGAPIVKQEPIGYDEIAKRLKDLMDKSAKGGSE